MAAVRSPIRMPLRAWTAIVVLLLSAAAAQASPRIVFAPSRALEAGQVVTVGWEGLPANVDELEFLLVLDDGEVVRLTPQFMPSKGSFGWTVPNLPSRAAVLELRAGIEGVETVLAASDPFVIHGVTRKAHVEFRDGEWWSLETGEPSAAPPAVHSVRPSGTARMFVRPRQWMPRAGTEPGAARELDTFEVTAPLADTRCGAPLVVPQRK
jgi:hypothetical protein